MKRLLPLCAVLVTGAAHSFAQPAPPVPSTMNFQGRIARPDGTPVPDTNTQTLTFSLYDAATNGNLLWTQTSTNVPVHNGVFSVKLEFATGFQSANTFLSTFANPLITPYLQIQVGTDAPLSPRQAFQSTAYAFVANMALTVPDGSLTAAKFAGGVLVPGGAAGGDLTGVYPNPALISSIHLLPKVTAGVITAAQEANPSVDQSQLHEDISVSGNATYWQSFTASQTQQLSGIDLYMGNSEGTPGRIGLIIRAGETTQGTPLYVSSFSYPGNFAVHHFDLTGTLPILQENSLYTFSVQEVDGMTLVLGAGIGNPYPRGKLLNNNALDLYFQTYARLDNVLTLHGSLTVTGTATLPNLSGDTTLTGNLNATGSVSVNGDVTVTGLATLPTISGNTNIAGNLGVAGSVYLNAAGTTQVGLSSTAGNGTVTLATDNGGGSPVLSLNYNKANGAQSWLLYADSTGGLQVGRPGQSALFTFAGNGAGNGRLGINKNDPAYALDVNGDINASGSVRANGVALTSDARYKTNIAPLDNALADILALRGVTYDWDRARWPQKRFPAGRQIGFIAQEVETVFPELVQTDADGYKGIQYQNLTPVLVEAVKSLHATVEAQNRKIEALTAELRKRDAEAEAKQKAALAELAAEIAELKKRMALQFGTNGTR